MQVEIEPNDSRFNKLLTHAIATFIQAVQRHGFQSPIEVKILDARWTPVRLLTVEPGGKITAQRTARKVFVYPLKIVGTDARQRIARVEIGANSFAREVEYLN